MGDEPTPTRKKQGLLDFAREQRLQECPVCQLPEEVRVELGIARKKHINRDTVLAYITKIHGYSGDDEALTSHNNGHHDRKLKELAQ